MSTETERLTSIRTRIANLRAILEDPNHLTNVSIAGLSENVDRAGLRAELKELEREENLLTGRTRRAYSIDLTRC